MEASQTPGRKTESVMFCSARNAEMKKKRRFEDSSNNHSKRKSKACSGMEEIQRLCAARICIHMQGFLSPRSKVQGRTAARSCNAFLNWTMDYTFPPKNKRDS
ncbi:unnamed protein product [Coffea canephora]|uniref:DH200=94 genomic scaffold, scaffold_688 n=1 Tax=Coffea canephora TaxID=49390 RepID=A0A068VG52_COFCA|nr:unnamed protein product [Coffea canephora]